MSVVIGEREVRTSDLRCPFCRDALQEGEPAWHCPECETEHHDECARENAGCTLYGCGVESPTRPTPSALRAARWLTLFAAWIAFGVFMAWPHAPVVHGRRGPVPFGDVPMKTVDERLRKFDAETSERAAEPHLCGNCYLNVERMPFPLVVAEASTSPTK